MTSQRTYHMNGSAPAAVSFLITALASDPPAGLPKATPAEVGLSAEKLREIKPALEKLVADDKNAGGVVSIARHGKVAYFETYGYRDLESKTPMTADTIFTIASMTKPITCIGVMRLVEEGKIKLDDPVEKFIPALKDMNVLGDPKEDKDEAPATVPSKRSITIRDLLSHSSGLAYGGLLSPSNRLSKAYKNAGVDGFRHNSIEELANKLAKVPLAHQPGEGWTYGLSHDVLGRVIEVASGETFDAYLKAHIFDPLDMPDTFFYVPEDKRERVATIYRVGLGEKLTALPRNFGSKTFFSGGGGLFSTAHDYTRFGLMLAAGGELDGKRIVKSETITLMTTNQIGANSAFGVSKYGLGFGLIFDHPSQGQRLVSRYFWGGYFSTNFWVSPKQDIVAVVMTQILPTNFGATDGVVRIKLDEAVESK